MDAHLSVTVRRDLAELERIGHVVERFGAQHDLSSQVIFEITLALDEVLTNVISYAYDDGGEHAIVVRLSIHAGELAVEVEDDGRPFNPLDVPLPNIDAPLEQRPIGGLGMHLVRQVMTTVEYHRHAGKNLLRMRKAVVR